MKDSDHPGRDAVSVIEDLEQRLAEAWISRDRGFIENLLDDDWTVTDPSGRILTKQHVIDETFSSPDRQIDSMMIDDVKVRILGTAAIASGRTRATGRYQGQSAAVALRFIDVFHLVDGEWKVVASQGTLIAPQL